MLLYIKNILVLIKKIIILAQNLKDESKIFFIVNICLFILDFI
jgi:hypothetical protein